MGGARGRSFPGRCLTVLLLLAALGTARHQGAAAAGSKGFIAGLGRKEFSSRGLLRNATVALHGAVRDYGYYYATLWLGTPPNKYELIVDTGSTVTYVPCAECTACGTHRDKPYDLDKSSTSIRIPCNSDQCMCGSPACTCNHENGDNQCAYSRHYAEQSSSEGILVADMMHLNDGQKPVEVVFGCETKETGEIYKQEADGLLGLGMSEISIPTQLADNGVIDDVFSLCFGSVLGGGALVWGALDLPEYRSEELTYTDMVHSPAHPYYYNVRLKEMRVDKQALSVTQQEWEGTSYSRYGVVLDSGTTFTYLPTPAFTAFVDAVVAYAKNKGLTKVSGPDPRYDDVCLYKKNMGLDDLDDHFPSHTLEFAGNAELTLPPINYLFVHSRQAGAYCIGIFDNGNDGSILGGITFRNTLVQYDRKFSRVGFANARCADIGSDHPDSDPCSATAAPWHATYCEDRGSAAVADEQPGPGGLAQSGGDDVVGAGLEEDSSWDSLKGKLISSLMLAVGGFLAVAGVAYLWLLREKRIERASIYRELGDMQGAGGGRVSIRPTTT